MDNDEMLRIKLCTSQHYTVILQSRFKLCLNDEQWQRTIYIADNDAVDCVRRCKNVVFGFYRV